MHLFFCDRMHEPDLRGMEHQTTFAINHSPFAIIQPIPDNRRVHSVRMRGMDTQLVRSTGERIEIDDERAVGTLFANMIARDSGLAMRPIYHLPRSVIGIRQERKVYRTFRLVICDW